MPKRASATLAALVLGLLVAVPTASATNMTPLVTCIEPIDGGYLAHFGYRSDESVTVTRSVAKSEGKNAWLNLVYDGPANDWTTVVDGTIDRGQPTTFEPGVHPDAFSVPFSGSQVTWALVGRFATATAQSPICEVETPETPTTPVTPTTPEQPPVTPADTAVPAASAPAPAPAVAPASKPAKRVCTSRRRLTIRLRERKGRKIRSARVVFRTKTIATSRRTKDGRVIAKIDFRKLPSGRFSVKIRAKLTNGRTVTYTRKYYTCKPKLGPANNLKSKQAL